MIDYKQQQIQVPITIERDGVLSGPRPHVPPVARVGGTCQERRCEFNIDGRCGSWIRRRCPDVEATDCSHVDRSVDAETTVGGAAEMFVALMRQVGIGWDE